MVVLVRCVDEQGSIQIVCYVYGRRQASIFRSHSLGIVHTGRCGPAKGPWLTAPP